METPSRPLSFAPLAVALLACAARAPAAPAPAARAPVAGAVASAGHASSADPGELAATEEGASRASAELARPAAPSVAPGDARCPGSPASEPARPEAPEREAVAAGAPEALDAVTIRDVVRSHADGFMGCYQLGLGQDPALRGRVTTRFDIDPRGKISELSIASSELFDCAVIDCIRDHFVTIEFPPPGSVVTVLYPLVFGHAD